MESTGSDRPSCWGGLWTEVLVSVPNTIAGLKSGPGRKPPKSIFTSAEHSREYSRLEKNKIIKKTKKNIAFYLMPLSQYASILQVLLWHAGCLLLTFKNINHGTEKQTKALFAANNYNAWVRNKCGANPLGGGKNKGLLWPLKSATIRKNGPQFCHATHSHGGLTQWATEKFYNATFSKGLYLFIFCK